MLTLVALLSSVTARSAAQETPAAPADPVAPTTPETPAPAPDAWGERFAEARLEADTQREFGDERTASRRGLHPFAGVSTGYSQCGKSCFGLALGVLGGVRYGFLSRGDAFVAVGLGGFRQRPGVGLSEDGARALGLVVSFELGVRVWLGIRQIAFLGTSLLTRVVSVHLNPSLGTSGRFRGTAILVPVHVGVGLGPRGAWELAVVGGLGGSKVRGQWYEGGIAALAELRAAYAF